MLERYPFLDTVIEEITVSGRLYDDFADIIVSGLELRNLLQEMSEAVSDRYLSIKLWNTAYSLEMIPYPGLETPLENFTRDMINDFEPTIQEILVRERLVKE